MTVIRRAVVFAPNWLGDVVMALPALAAVRAWMPEAHLAVAARASVAPVLTLASGVDEVVTLTGLGRIGDTAGRAADAARIATGRYDAALLLPNSFHAAWIARRAGVPQRWGYRADLRGWMLTRAIARPAGRPTQAEYYQALVRALGAPETPNVAALEPPEAARAAAAALLRDGGWRGEPLVAFAPGAASGPAKRWPTGRVARVAATLAEQAGAAPVLVGAAADRPAIDEVVAGYEGLTSSKAPPLIDLGGRTDIPLLAAVLSLCHAALTNDSGAMHLAAAVGVPVTAIFGPTDERATSPLPHPLGRPVALVSGRAWCRPCHLRRCPIDHRCMTSIDPARVSDIVLGHLRGSDSRA